MKNNNEFFHNIIDHVHAGICITDQSGRTLYYNDAFAQYFSVPAFSAVIRFDQLPKQFRDISLSMECCEKKESLTNYQPADAGKISAVASPVFDQEQNFLYCVETLIFPDRSREPETVTGRENHPDHPSTFDEIVLNDRTMDEINQTISRTAYFDSTILIQGESGTGKTVLAKHIHKNSRRANKPFVTINCGSIPENLIESELFGYASGAFTSASQKGKPGQVEMADGGTLFLDEIGLLPYDLQAKFLQLIQEKTYTPVGSLKSKTVDVRIISATNLNLKEQIKQKKFREDLYYRLRVIELFIPPLRERVDAIEALVHYFLKKYNREFGTQKTITSQAISLLKGYNWPGNIRELQYLMERTIITSGGTTITSSDIPPLQEVETPTPAPNKQLPPIQAETFDAAIEELEKQLLTKAFQEHHSSYKVADALGITQSKASRLLRKYKISSSS